MGAAFLRKLIGRATPAPPPEWAPAVIALAQVAKERPSLTGPALLLAEVLAGMFRAPIQESAPSLSAEQVATKLASGIPLLRGETLDLNIAAFRRRWESVCAAVGAAELLLTIERGSLDAREMLANTLAGRPEAIHARADALGLDAALVTTVLRLTLFPVLAHVNTQLLSLRQTALWDKGYCPTCGSWPLLGEYRGLGQVCLLRCGLCAAEWAYSRLRCPFCETDDHRQLGYFHVEQEEGQRRVSTCAACHGYIKMVSTLMALSPTWVLVTDLATIHLDLAAAERGFVPA